MIASTPVLLTRFGASHHFEFTAIHSWTLRIEEIDGWVHGQGKHSLHPTSESATEKAGCCVNVLCLRRSLYHFCTDEDVLVFVISLCGLRDRPQSFIQ